jgi:hypothetical protein
VVADYDCRRISPERLRHQLGCLPFFIPLAFAEQLGLNFWSAFVIEIAAAAATIGVWLLLGPRLA